jgi:hypothetical protein
MSWLFGLLFFLVMLRPSPRSAAIIGALINALITCFLCLVYAFARQQYAKTVNNP